MDEILARLRALKLPEDRRRNVRTDENDKKLGCVLGLIHDYKRNRYISSVHTSKNLELAKLLCDYIKKEHPDFSFTSIQLNSGSSALHVDTMNQGKSMIMSLGEHTGGQLYMYPRTVLDIKNHLQEIDGLLPHMTLPFEGERFSIVYFTLRPCQSSAPNPASQALLDECGFSRLPKTRSKEQPKRKLLEEAATILEHELHVPRDCIGDWTNRSIPVRCRRNKAL